MTTTRRLLLVLACGIAGLLAVTVGARAASGGAVKSDRYLPELAYLKQVNRWRPPSDPELVFLLMGQFANANRHAEGADYLDTLRKRFDAQLDDQQRAIYLTAIASLRAGAAGEVPLLMRIGWVRDTVRMLDDAKRLTRGEGFIMRWMSGIVRAQLPWLFGERDMALADLTWCATHADKAPHAGWLREVHFHLAAVHRQIANDTEAQRQQTLSGYASATKPAIFTTPFSDDAIYGHQFSPRAIREVVPNTVYLLSGFEFTEYYFIVSANRRELIAIDAGMRR